METRVDVILHRSSTTEAGLSIKPRAPHMTLIPSQFALDLIERLCPYLLLLDYRSATAPINFLFAS